jgi:cytochrome c553
MTSWITHVLALAVLWLACGSTLVGAADTPPASTPQPNAAAVEFFETKVRTVLVQRCFRCHGPKSDAEAGLRLDSLARMLRGGRSGPAIVPGKPRESLLILAINHDTFVHMPPKKMLPRHEIADLTAWVQMGAPWPNAQVPVHAAAPSATEIQFTEADRSFWAFQPPVDPPIPSVQHKDWPQSPLDHFVLARLEAKGLKPAPPADKRTLIRRATLDLHGLPPTPAEIDAFLGDDSPNAFARVVNRLLGSPRYGESWGRHWLDVVRYADSNGMDDNLAYVDAWRYRDYVVAAFNKDKPYDRFIREQLAGDLLAPAELDDPYEGLIATGFLTLGPKMLAEDDPVKQQMDIVDDQIDTTGRAFLGLTLGCARCHDHKFDPLPTADYYSLAGIFKSTQVMLTYRVDSKWKARALGPAPLEERLTALEREIDRLDKILVLSDRSKMSAEERKRLTEQLAAATEEYHQIPKAMAVQDARAENLHVFLRGNHLTRGVEVPRRFPRILAGQHQRPISDRHSGRLELAGWLASSGNPLTSRVMANRIWQGHFGEGIVRSPDNLGRLGERPDNQPLLDWLARRLREGGWSIKALHRRIMLSSTYQMSTAYNAQAAALDPDNRLLWRMNRRRLEAEAMRDAILAVSGQLDGTMGGSLLGAKSFENLSETKRRIAYDSRRRSLYVPVLRGALYDVFQAFDFPDPAVVGGKRTATTVAPQALFMLNHPLLAGAARRMAEQALLRERADDAGRVRTVYEQVLGRPPADDEVQEWLEFLRRHERAQAGAEADRRQRAWQSLCQVLLSSNEFLYVD